jgi:lipopolysaccharide transport system permease protein
VICVPLVLIPLCLLVLGLGAILSVANAAVRDIGHVMHVLLGFWMFLTRVIYPAPTRGHSSLLNVLNPVSPFVIAVHDLTSRGVLSQPGGFAIGCAVAAIVFLLGWRIFSLAESSIVERV